MSDPDRGTSPDGDREGETRQERPGSPSTPRPGGAGRSFAPGTRVADRWVIERFVAVGGMGEVYEATDTELRDRVALKTLRPDLADDARALERFRREVHLARRVTHPNVCRIFDVGHHAPVGGGPEVHFLTMELLDGEPLSKRIAAARLPREEILAIVRQVAAAVDAAHDKGVIHRDLKPGNVMLSGAGPSLRAVVTDFGIARGAGDPFADTVSQAGFIGSPAYMAPEQAQAGATVGPAADVYALGVMLYELATGVRPFEGDNSLATAMQRLLEPPKPPRAHAPDLDARWEAAILRCLELDPARRFATATELARALDGDAPPAPAAPAPVAVVAPARRRTALVIAATGLVLVAGAVLAWRHLHSTGSARSATAEARRSVAVMGFRNLSGRAESAWLSTALSQMLATELSVGDRLRTIPGEDVARARAELKLPDADAYSAETLSQVRGNLGADDVVIGSYFALGDAGGRVRLDLRLQDAATGQTIAAIADEGTAGALPDLAVHAGAQLRARLGLGDVSSSEAASVRASLPSLPEAARAYSEGLAHLEQLDAMGARPLLERAVSLEPDHPLPHAALARAQALLGYDARARAEATLARERSASLPPTERREVEAMSREIAKEWPQAIPLYQALVHDFPDDIRRHLHLANAYIASGQFKEALAAAAAMRQLGEVAAGDARVDLVEAEATMQTGDYRRCVAASQEAVRKASARGARTLVGMAKFFEGRAHSYLGEGDAARRSLEESRAVFEAVGNKAWLARAINGIGVHASDVGDKAEARARFAEALAIYRAIGNQQGVMRQLNNSGTIVADDEGDYRKAQKIFEEALAISQDIGDRGLEPIIRGNIADILTQLGEYDAAKRHFTEAVALAQEVGLRASQAQIMDDFVWTLEVRGDLDEASAVHDKALELAQSSGQTHVIGQLLNSGGDLSRLRDRLDDARRDLDRSVAMFDESGQRGQAANARVARARVALVEGRAADAEKDVRQALVELEQEHTADDTARAQTVLAESLLAEGHPDEASGPAAIAATVARTADGKLMVRVVAAHVAAARGRLADARRDLAAVVQDAAKIGCLEQGFAARLALGEIEPPPRRPATRAQLAKLAAEARARGYSLFARQAEALAR